jgi:hypothetical protein
MTDTTDRFRFPFLAAGQAQKEMTHNEALALIDLLLAATVEASDAVTPPDAPTPGQAWLLGPAPTGAWAGQANAIAGWTAGGWRFVAPVEGARARLRQTGEEAVFTSGSWIVGTLDAVQLRIGGTKVIGAQQSPIIAPSGGDVTDANARATIGQILGVLRDHGLIAAA